MKVEMEKAGPARGFTLIGFLLVIAGIGLAVVTLLNAEPLSEVWIDISATTTAILTTAAVLFHTSWGRRWVANNRKEYSEKRSRTTRSRAAAALLWGASFLFSVVVIHVAVRRVA
jgi:hypothetical protein